ncbi:ubiquitin carboxyl-terminal hydrolase 36 isoform X2 [Teleopsis dalmanni]|uniref:ubiquitin carboxyl-terminal hydrolase 36 isoform X2 n=1 Tax=Teleopsis dalmanni TaxID=139649 RepID=UPI0018CFA97C|nr:ubiquitin carboxyl-terminal hydrolase 36 isoform X2 [Teleopsis dalmanni]
MPVSAILEPYYNDVNAALRESFSRSYVALNDSKPGSSSLKTKNSKSADNIHSKLISSTKRILISSLEYEEIKNYSENILDPLKNKYAVLNQMVESFNMDNGSVSPTPRIKNGLNGGATDSKKFQHIPSNNDGNVNGSNSHIHKYNCNVFELPKPKRVLFQRDDVRVGWKNGTHRWQIGVGMLNVGNTCYLNSTLQALFHLPSMANWLLSDTEHQEECDAADMNCIICAMAKTLQESQTHQSAIRPYRVYSKLKLICKHLVMGRQEDAHEFMRYLVEAMEKSYLSRFRNHKELDQYSKETTPLNQILGGYLKTAVRCLACGHVSVTFQHFQDLLLDIRKADTIEEALEGYFSRERLEDMGYKCESCKKKVSATKQFSLERAPIALCVQLKRFSMLGTKIHKQITLKPKLDLSKFVSRKTTGEQLTYKLVSMVTHLGASQHGGHYTAIGLTESGVYYNYDDSFVRPINVQSVCNTNAYIILYELDSITPRQVTSTQISNGDIKENLKKTNGYISNNAHRIIGPQLPGLGYNNCSNNASINKTPENCYSYTNGGTKLGINRQNGIQINNNSKVLIHFKNNYAATKTSTSSPSTTFVTSTTENSNCDGSVANTQVQNGFHTGSWKFQESLCAKATLSNTSDNENEVSSSSHMVNKALSSKSSLPSMPKLSDSGISETNSQSIGNVKKNATAITIPKNLHKSLVPYESESDDEQVSEITHLNKSVNSELGAIKRCSSSSLSINDHHENNYKDFKILTECKTKKSVSSLGNGITPNLINTNNCSNSQSKSKTANDAIEEIFKNNHNNPIQNNTLPTSIKRMKQQAIVTSTTHTVDSDKEHEIFKEYPRSPLKRSQSTPPSPPVIKTKTGFWQVTSLNSTTASTNLVEQKVTKNPKNPFAVKINQPTQTKKQKMSTDKSLKRSNLTNNGYTADTGDNSSISELLSQSHRGYGAPVLTWSGEKALIEKEVNHELRDQRQRDWNEDEDNDMDRGRQKKIKSKKTVNGNCKTDGYNPFQEHENHRRWKSHTHRFHRGHFRRQFQRNKYKFPKFNDKTQRAHQRNNNVIHNRRSS